MSPEELIRIEDLCQYYKVETSFIDALNEYGLIEIRTIKQKTFIEKDRISDFERMLRLHDELGINFEGIDVINHLLHRIDELQNELTAYKNRLRLYE